MTARATDVVAFTGFVPELTPYYDRARLAVAPLRFGAGVKGKVLDSMANGLPVIASPIAAEGIGATDGIHMAIGESDREFVDKLLELYRNELSWTTVRDNARQLIRENFSWEQARVVVQSLTS